MREIMAPALSDLTTLRLGGRALALVLPEKREELPLLAERAKELGAPLYIMGRGSNILAMDGEVPLVLVRMDAFDAIEIMGDSGESVYVRAGAGVSLKRLLRFCLERELSGLEGLVGIPGSVGGACAMNAGSFGVETGSRIHALEAWNGEKITVCGAEGIQPEYRKLTMRNCREFPLLLSATFALTRSLKKYIFQGMILNYLEKKSRQPLGVWSAGCAFKNPQAALGAGQLLDKAGFRGQRLGGMVFSQKHANFLVNTGRGTSAQAFELMDMAREKVKRVHGITLEPEIRIIP